MAVGGKTMSVVSAGGQSANFSINTYGVNETLRALRLFEKETFDALRTELVDEAKPLAQAVGASFPKQQPLQGWHKTGRKGDSRLPGYNPAQAAAMVKPIAGTGLARSGGRSILRIQQMSGGAQVYDTAGSRNAGQFIYNLDKHMRTKSRQKGYRSRVMFPAVKRNFALIEAGVRNVLDKVEKQTQRRLTEGIGGRF
jgi:hypothetical protein